MKGVPPGLPLCGAVQKYWKKRPAFLIEDTPALCGNIKVIILEKDNPDNQRLLALVQKMEQNVGETLQELQNELRRMAGNVVSSDHNTKECPNYFELYSIQPNHKRIKEEMSEDDDSSSSSEDDSY